MNKQSDFQSAFSAGKPMTRRQARKVGEMLIAYAKGGTPQYHYESGWRNAAIRVGHDFADRAKAYRVIPKRRGAK